jgi:hypothetical protein
MLGLYLADVVDGALQHTFGVDTLFDDPASFASRHGMSYPVEAFRRVPILPVPASSRRRILLAQSLTLVDPIPAHGSYALGRGLEA